MGTAIAPPFPVAPPRTADPPLPLRAPVALPPTPSSPPAGPLPPPLDVLPDLVPSDVKSPPHAVALTLAAAKAKSAARLSRVVGIGRSGAVAVSRVTGALQNGHAASLRRMCRSHAGHVIKLV